MCYTQLWDGVKCYKKDSWRQVVGGESISTHEHKGFG